MAIMQRLEELDKKLAEKSSTESDVDSVEAPSESKDAPERKSEDVESLASSETKSKDTYSRDIDDFKPTLLKRKVEFEGEEEFLKECDLMTGEVKDRPDIDETSPETDAGYMLSHFCRMQALADLGNEEDLSVIDEAHKEYLGIATTHPGLSEYFTKRRSMGRGYWWEDE